MLRTERLEVLDRLKESVDELSDCFRGGPPQLASTEKKFVSLQYQKQEVKIAIKAVKLSTTMSSWLRLSRQREISLQSASQALQIKPTQGE